MKTLIKDLVPMKWYFVYVAALLAWLAYANLTGDRMLTTDDQEEWHGGRSSGGTHYGIRSHK